MNENLSSLEIRLIEKALEAKKKAYAPYSNFHVGSALSTADGQIFVGCNVENSSYGLTVCAERNAIFHAVSQGHCTFDTIVVVTDGKDMGAPCGACLQVIQEFAPKAKIILAKSPTQYKVFHLSDFLPRPFSFDKR